MFGTFFGDDVEVFDIYVDKQGRRVAKFNFLAKPLSLMQLAPVDFIRDIKGDLECRCYDLPDGRQHVCSVCQHEQDRISREESEE
jgi:hypothetical protein